MAPRSLQRLLSEENPNRWLMIFSIFGLVCITAFGVVFVDNNIAFLLVPPSLMYFWIDWKDGKIIQREVNEHYEKKYGIGKAKAETEDENETAASDTTASKSKTKSGKKRK